VIDGLAAPSRASILIVDDRQDKLLVMQAVLEDLRQNIVCVSSGDEALREVLSREFAVILLDVNMPGLDGLETAALIRSRKKSAHTPIIFITADYDDEIHVAKGYALGAVDYIGSPVVPEVLRAKVRVFVDLYLLAQQAKLQAQEHVVLAEERAARAAAEQQKRRLAMLAEASGNLAASLDVSATAHELASVVLPLLADVSVLWLAPQPGRLARTELAWMGSRVAKRPALRSLDGIAEAWLAECFARVNETGKAETIEEAPVEEGAQVERETGIRLRSLIAVPLIARGRTLGVLGLGIGTSGREFDSDAFTVATEIAGRAAIAMDNALLYWKIRDEDQRKTEFLAMLAHELRNPLAPISNAVYVLDAQSPDPGKIKWAREIIGRQVKQLVRLVDDLLDLSRITGGKIELKIETLDVGAVVAAAVETSRPNIDLYEHSLSVLVPQQPLQMRGDYARISQVLANLINNAAKYTPRGGRISLTVAQESTDIVFRVRDSGIGIAPEHLSTIFDPFVQIDRASDRSQGGLGIGLTLVRQLVDMQSGSVHAYSEGNGRGSEFVVRLPAARALPATLEAGPELPEDALKDLCLLVVDDNRDVANSTATLMRMYGCDVHVAYDGREALEMVPRVHPEAILLDIGLPGMDGYQVVERLRREPGNQHILIIAISGYGQAEDRARSKAAGFDYHMVKPLDPDVLRQLLSNLSSRRPIPAENVVALGARRAEI
jgi:signal transduction histidine kinase/DNA-binding response OmpR family regulator